jgi:cytochrome c556
MQRSTRVTIAASSAIAAAFAISLTGLMAQAPGGQAPPPAANTPPKPLVPVAASSVYNTPDVYVNEYVTMTAAVEKNLTRTGFSVDQDKTKSTGKEVLVLAPTLQTAPKDNTYVTVIGQLIKFDPKEVASKLKDYKIDLSPEDMAKYAGKPVVLATSVIDTGGIDIAKKPIPPPTADDLTLQKQMTKLPGAQAALRKGMDSSSADTVKEQAGIMKAAFVETQAFWKSKNNAEAMGIAAEGVKHADTVLAAAAAGKWDDVKTAMTPLGAVCGNCHGKYRERMEDGTFRIKAGSFK